MTTSIGPLSWIFADMRATPGYFTAPLSIQEGMFFYCIYVRRTVTNSISRSIIGSEMCCLLLCSFAVIACSLCGTQWEVSCIHSGLSACAYDIGSSHRVQSPWYSCCISMALGSSPRMVPRLHTRQKSGEDGYIIGFGNIVRSVDKDLELRCIIWDCPPCFPPGFAEKKNSHNFNA